MTYISAMPKGTKYRKRHCVIFHTRAQQIAICTKHKTLKLPQNQSLPLYFHSSYMR